MKVDVYLQPTQNEKEPVLILALGSIAIVTFAKYSLSLQKHQIIVVSSLPKVEDAYFILRAKASNRVLYLRNSDPFSITLANHFGGESPSISRTYYQTLNFSVIHRLSPSAAVGEIEKVSRLERLSTDFPNLALAICLGIGVGLLIPLGFESLVPALLMSCVTAVLKVISACPTCPRPDIAGIDSATLGAVVFGVLAAICLIPDKSSNFSNLRKWVLLAAIFCALGWQLISWWSYKLQCVPCTGIGFTLAWLISSSGRWFHESWAKVNLKSLVVATVMVTMIGIQVAPHVIANPTKQSFHLAALGQAKPLKITDIRESGLTASGHNRVIFVAAKHCPACESSLATIDSIPLTGITFLYVGFEPPDSHRKWALFRNSSSIQTTPTTLFVDGKGKVIKQSVGFNPEPRALADYLQQISSFLSAQ